MPLIKVRADTEAELIAALPWARADNVWIQSGDGFSFFPVGPIPIKSATYNITGEELAPAIYDNGFNANIEITDNDILALIPESVLV